MITGGHIAVSYLIAEGAKSIGIPLNSNQVLGVLIAGNLSDVDFFVGFISGKKGELHHQNITHTPFGVFLIWLSILVIFETDFLFSLILLFAMLTHLFLDDLGHIAGKIGIYQGANNPQINWLYPFTKYSTHHVIKGNKEVLKHYLTKGWPIALLELILIVFAVIVFLIRN